MYNTKCPQGVTYQKPVTESSLGGATLDIDYSIVQILGKGSGGPILVSNVQVGSEIEAGALLAALDTTDLAFAVQQAEAALAVSQALLKQAIEAQSSIPKEWRER